MKERDRERESEKEIDEYRVVVRKRFRMTEEKKMPN